MELGEVHRLPDGDTATIPKFCRIPHHPTADRELLDAREDSKNGMLVQDTLRTCSKYLTIAWKEKSTEHRAQTNHNLVLQGKLWTAVICITDREMGGFLQPGEQCTNTADRVMEVLRAKHPDTQAPTAAILDSYPDRPLEFAPVYVTYNIQHGDGCCGVTLGQGRDWWDGLGNFTALAPED